MSERLRERVYLDPRQTVGGMQTLLEFYAAYFRTDDTDYQEVLADLFWATVTAYECDDESVFERSVLKYRLHVQRRINER